MKKTTISWLILQLVLFYNTNGEADWQSDAIKESNPRKKVDILVNTVREKLSTNLEEAHTALNLAFSAAEAVGDYDSKASCRIAQLAYEHTVNPDNSAQLLQELTAEADKMNTNNQFYFYLAKANIELEREDYRNAFVSANHAIIIDSLHPKVCYAYNAVARVYEFWYDRDSALHYYELALEKAEKGSLVYAIFLYNLGDFYTTCSDFPNAESKIKDALSIFKLSGAGLHINNATYNLARVYSESGQYSLAIQTAHEGLDICKNYSLFDEYYLYYVVLLEDYIRINDEYNSAIYSNILLGASSDSKSDLASGSYCLALYYQSKYNILEAVACSKKAIEYSHTIGDWKVEHESLRLYLALTNSYLDKDRDKLARRYFVLNDSMSASDKRFIVSILKQRRDAENEVETIRAKFQQTVGEYKTALFATLIALMVVTIFLFLGRKYRKMCIQNAQNMRFYKLFATELGSIVPRVNEIVTMMEFDGTPTTHPHVYQIMKNLQTKLFNIQEKNL